MSESIIQSMASGDPSLDQKNTAAKVMANKIGNLLELRGFKIVRKKIFVDESRASYGVDYGFEPSNPLMDGSGMQLRYWPDESPSRLSLHFLRPKYKSVTNKSYTMNIIEYRSDYEERKKTVADDMRSKVLTSVLDNWSDQHLKAIKSNKAWRNCGKNVMAKIEILVKYIETIYPFYIALYQEGKWQAIERQAQVDEYNKYAERLAQSAGCRSEVANTYGSSLMYDWNIGDLKEVNVQVDLEHDGKVVLNQITLDKNKAGDFLKHLIKWRNN